MTIVRADNRRPQTLNVLMALLFLGCHISKADPANNQVIRPEQYQAFNEALQSTNNKRALSLGKDIFQRLEHTFRQDPGFQTYQSKLAAAEFLARQMASHLKRARDEHLLNVTQVLFDSYGRSRRPPGIPPAKHFYETSQPIFRHPVNIASLDQVGKNFLRHYYNLILQTLIEMIAQAGQALSIADPHFQETHSYVLVLPLLHNDAEQVFDIRVLPFWMRKPEQLDVFADICALHFKIPVQAMQVAKTAANIRHQKFSPIIFYRNMAAKCETNHADVAVACLTKAIEIVPESQKDYLVALRFEIAQRWWDSGNYPLAAAEAQLIMHTFPYSENFSEAVNLYYYALSRSNNHNAILRDIDTAIRNPRCKACRAKLMYIKWWALHRQQKNEAAIAALEYDLLKHYPNDAMVAPIMLSQAVDLLAQQDYASAQISLQHLVDKFPNSKVAIQAQKMLEKLFASTGR